MTDTTCLLLGAQVLQFRHQHAVCFRKILKTTCWWRSFQRSIPILVEETMLSWVKRLWIRMHIDVSPGDLHCTGLPAVWCHGAANPCVVTTGHSDVSISQCRPPAGHQAATHHLPNNKINRDECDIKRCALYLYFEQCSSRWRKYLCWTHLGKYR